MEMNQNMNAPIVTAGHGTPRTESIAIAASASSATPIRIDDFIRRQFAARSSDDFSGIRSTSQRASSLGFVSSANSRYAQFLEAYHGTPALAAHYAEHYPASCFLPWKALHATIKSLNLWCELPEFYAGAVPSEQLPWMEIFELRPDDRMTPDDVSDMLPGLRREVTMALQIGAFGIRYMVDRCNGWYGPPGELERVHRMMPTRWQEQVHSYWADAATSFFVVAPPEAFTSSEDWLTRFRKLETSVTAAPTQAPDDPLVLRFCRGGALVVAAWGDEGAWLNSAMREVERV